MTIDTSTLGSPGWKLQRLASKLESKQADYQLLDDYYTGRAQCRPLQSRAQRDAYRRLMHYARTNYAELIVEAVRERLKVANFRTGAAGDEHGDRAAWGIWQANQLDADSSLVHRYALTMRDAYVIVGQFDPEIGAPLITIEDPRTMVIEYDPVRRRRPVSALKVRRADDLGLDIFYLYLLDSSGAWVLRAGRTTRDGIQLTQTAELDWLDQTRLPIPQLPVVGFHNRQAGTESFGEFEPHIPLLDRINFSILSRLEIATIQAFRQRAAKGGPTHDPETGNEIDYSDVFNADPGAFWHLPEGMELWESGQVDLGPLQKSIRDDVQDLAASTRTPLFYLTPDAANGSAEGASLAREGLVFKAEDRQQQFGESWEQVMSLAFLMAGDAQRALRRDMETIWAPVERFSLAERYDAASKATDILPRRTIQTDVLQFSPQDADRMAAEAASEALLAPDTTTADQAAQQPVQAVTLG